jgi:IS66 C-terminal element
MEMHNGLNPEAYLADVIDRMAKGHSINRLSELLPWNWNNLDTRLASRFMQRADRLTLTISIGI